MSSESECKHEYFCIYRHPTSNLMCKLCEKEITHEDYQTYLAVLALTAELAEAKKDHQDFGQRYDAMTQQYEIELAEVREELKISNDVIEEQRRNALADPRQHVAEAERSFQEWRRCEADNAALRNENERLKEVLHDQSN